ncbi:hypothetical protein OE88DRAFT_763363 [Heliocybe sulcata]|uniref:Uncharacterized protein n=1 Tax=Heliocybe sulcata TaxID=5364 RepID=A0A5C3MR58_9AGAM|nr:hypothetical protein OE88DRAFT_763363 [Heliocybe sulcata]
MSAAFTEVLRRQILSDHRGAGTFKYYVRVVKASVFGITRQPVAEHFASESSRPRPAVKKREERRLTFLCRPRARSPYVHKIRCTSGKAVAQKGLIGLSSCRAICLYLHSWTPIFSSLLSCTLTEHSSTDSLTLCITRARVWWLLLSSVFMARSLSRLRNFFKRSGGFPYGPCIARPLYPQNLYNRGLCIAAYQTS